MGMPTGLAGLADDEWGEKSGLSVDPNKPKLVYQINI
jgi:hypothetical protein